MTTKNIVGLDERGIIVVRYFGDQTLESARQVEADVHALAEALRVRGEPVRILADLAGLGASTAGSRRAAKETIDRLPDARIGVHSGNTVTKHLARFIMLATGRERGLRYLDDEPSARRWILAGESLA